MCNKGEGLKEENHWQYGCHVGTSPSMPIKGDERKTVTDMDSVLIDVCVIKIYCDR